MKKCFCGNESLFDGATIGIVSISESGEIVNSHDTEDSSMSLLVPMCFYHMVLAKEGIIAMTAQNQLVTVNWLNEMESKSDQQLKILSTLRSAELKEKAHCAKAVFEARKAQSSMDKGAKENE